MTPMVYYISWSIQCVVAWFPGSEEVSKLSLPADKEVEPKLYPAVPSSPGCGLLGQRPVFIPGNCIWSHGIDFSLQVWIYLVLFEYFFIFHAKPFMIWVFRGIYGNFYGIYDNVYGGFLSCLAFFILFLIYFLDVIYAYFW